MDVGSNPALVELRSLKNKRSWDYIDQHKCRLVDPPKTTHERF